ncbi:undecaprenyl-diphosphatase UppP [Candidatus Dojkabacteria bacterium]|nr:undecaprenyl-diphosphatase UppP [Candidatus Dojkabacteria bacterium]
MDIFQAIVLGIIEGLTEFIPISSTGHLIIFSKLFNWEIPFAYDLIIQLGAYLAVLTYFAPKLLLIAKSFLLFKKPELSVHRNLGYKILLSSIPAGIIGFIAQEYIEIYLHNGILVSIVMILFALVMLYFDKKENLKKKVSNITYRESILIGLWEILAIIPGVSRSGSTIVGAVNLGYKREDAAEISFLFGIPLIIAAGLKGCFDLYQDNTISQIELLPVVVGFLTSFIVGYIAIKFLINFLKTNSLKPFVIYRIVVGIIFILFLSKI